MEAFIELEVLETGNLDPFDVGSENSPLMDYIQAVLMLKYNHRSPQRDGRCTGSQYFASRLSVSFQKSRFFRLRR